MAAPSIPFRRSAALAGALITLLLTPVAADAITRNVDGANPACSDVTGTPYCTVQSAVSASSAGDVIAIAAGSYIEQITLDRNVTLRGAGISAVAGSCNGQTNILGASPISVVAGARVVVASVTIKGSANPLGGGVFNAGTLTLQNSEVCQNSTIAQGGGLYTSGRLTLFNVQVYDNVPDLPGVDGGGLYVAAGGAAIVNQSSFSDNRAARGGAISVAAGGRLVLSNSTLEANFADSSGGSPIAAWGGGIYNAGVTIIDRTQIGTAPSRGNVVLDSFGKGGGIYNEGNLLVTRSGILGNIVDYGLSSPPGISYGAGIANDATLSLSNVTITENSNGGAAIGQGAGIYAGNGSVTVRNSIIASQLLGSDCEGAITTDGHNIDTDATCDLVSAALGGTDQPAVASPGLLPLGSYGGPTLTHNLADDSPAIDMGNPAGCLADLTGGGVANVPLRSDQRGNIFVEVAGMGGDPSGCDVGAVEFNLLANGMFEDDGDGDHSPDGWTGTSLLGADRLFCLPRLAHEGRCYFLLRGHSARTKQLSQEVSRSGGAGDDYTLRVFTGGSTVTGNPVVRLQFDDLGTVGIEEEFVLPLQLGTYDYLEQTLSVTTTHALGYDVVRVIIEDGLGGGLAIDDVSLVHR